ncbi:MAG: hypothetical protein P4M09_23310 [Devosia sp.]|nr:hypothetical protein [Devosia sp.]
MSALAAPKPVVAKLLAMGAYFYQSVLAFGLLMVVARILAPADYATYSVFIATTQVGAVAGFEWLRFACSRFYPGQTPGTEREQRRTLLVEGLACGVVCVVVGAAAIPLGLPPALALIGGAVSAGQGSSDLHLSVVRFAQRFGAFSWLNGIRASMVAIGTLTGAVLTHTVTGAVAGLLGAYVVYAVVAVVGDRGAYASAGRFRWRIVREHATYGGVSAGMAVLGLLSPLGLKLILTTTLGKEAAAGVLLALDLLQRPFVMVISALQTVEYPDVVAAYDRNAPDFPQRLGRFYALMATLSLISAAVVYVGLRPVAEIVVSPTLRDAFLLTAPLVTLFSMLRALTQNISTTPAHLQLNLGELALLAVVDCVSFNLLAYGASVIFGAQPLLIVAGATIGAVLAGSYGLRIAASLRVDLPVTPLLIAGLAMLVPAVMLFIPTPNVLLGAALNGVSAGAISLAALLELYVAWRRPPRRAAA